MYSLIMEMYKNVAKNILTNYCCSGGEDEQIYIMQQQ